MRRARSSRPTCTNAIGSASAAERTRRPSKGPSSRRTPSPPATRARTSASTSVGAVMVSSTFIACFYHRPVRARILGSAAGGGFPQWNCRCPTCEAARTGTEARPRTQSSLAIRGADGPWLLVNASPDLRQQLEGLTDEPVDGVRAAPVAAVLLTDAEIDHTAGLLLLRESSTALRVYGSGEVRRALTEGYPVLPILGSYSGVDWRTLQPGGPLPRGRGAPPPARGPPAARRAVARGRGLPRRRRRAPLPGRERRRRGGHGAGLPRSVDGRRPDVRARPRATGRRRARPLRGERR